ncbi:MAG TPA: MlaD family protein [Candidatus Dormibacteraeota bacterium]|nr:MlaD family protein [Candidatus Dormibacteraeota bacterium]
MSERGRRISPIVAGLIAGVVIGVIVAIMAKINLDFAAPWSSTHTVSMAVTDADGISASSDVRIAGRLVGQVTGVQSEGQYSTVTFHVDDSEWPLPADTTASIRLATLLGQKYVELQPGSDKKDHLADNATIDLTRTKPVVDFDQILSTFDQPTRTALTDIIKTAGAAVNGQEGTLQQLLPALGDLSQHSVTPTGELVTRDSELSNILVNLGSTADQLDQSRNDLAGVIDNLNSVTGALAQNTDSLRGFIRNTDAWNQTTDAVLGNGGAQNFNAGLARLDSLAGRVNATFATLIPQSQAFDDDPVYGGKKPIDSAIDLIYTIGDAASQGDAWGNWLRQNVNSADFSGLVPTVASPSGAGAAGTAPKSGSPLPKPPPLPPLPISPQIPLPGLPSIGGSNGSSTNGGGGVLPTSPSLTSPGGINLIDFSDQWLADYSADWGMW